MAPLHVAAAGRWRRIEHLRCWGEAHAASRVRGRRHRPVGSALARIDPRIGAVGPRSGCSRVTSVVLCEGKEVCSHLIEHFSRTTRILGSLYSQGLELWRLTSSERCRGGQRDSRSRFVQLNDPKIMQDAFLNELQPLTSRFCKLPSP